MAPSNAMHLVEPRTRLTADVQMLDTRAAMAKQVDGMLVYPDGAEEGDLVVRPTPEGPEDYVLYARKPRQEQANDPTTWKRRASSNVWPRVSTL